jgi:hypothetical protein
MLALLCIAGLLIAGPALGQTVTGLGVPAGGSTTATALSCDGLMVVGYVCRSTGPSAFQGA